MYTGISQINALYRRLADLETNIYKRFVVVTSMSRDMFSKGLNSLEMNMFKESLQLLSNHKNGAVLYGVIQRALDDYLSNICDLSYLIQSYQKPLLSYANGVVGGFATSVVSLANVSACHKHSRMAFNNLEHGMPLLGGQSCTLAMLRGSLGEYLLLTGHELAGADLVWSGLVRRYISPDAFHVMQLTAERQVEMPEKETEFQLQEHFLQLDSRYSLDKFEWLIHEHFNRSSVASILRSLERGVSAKKMRSHSSINAELVRKWEIKTLDTLTNHVGGCTEEFDIALKLIRDVKSYKLQVLKTLDISPNRWNEMRDFVHIPPVSANDHKMSMMLHSIHSEILLEALQLEVASWLGYLGRTLQLPSGDLWSRSKFSSHPFTPCYRSGFSLSSLPALRRLHPDFDPRTGSDHDAVRMKRLCERWSDDFLQRELFLMQRILT
ncbi:enoyl- hydratase isomerase family protein [Babesia ovata]|uniref:Enoyl-hydratase isomerase family protein n=1 Tax=Babesia ovata TaxID=189622 RepID=A0A2H6KHA1_9APIC|nr:enoyl- hydratase isomerase family protein [Babesia ovata]GBE62370.1 enoyl- hydratase isomerase family protein [Babesia ovata]